MTDAPLWYFARGTGLVSLILLTVVVALGVASRFGRPAFGLPRFAVQLLHRNAALLAVVLLAGHLISLYFDPYAKLRLLDLVIPFAGQYRPFWLGLGTLAVDLMLVIVATSLLRQRIGARGWRIVHSSAYLCWPIAMLHGLQTGTDSGTWWMRTVLALCAVLMLAAVAWRVSPTFHRFPQRVERRVRTLESVR